jgi:peptidoglycan/LPS O-acetylase OafA/YrhL
LRLALALVVLVSHLSAFNIGRPAVVLFFVLSGYWVSRRWLAGGDGVLGFASSRLLRIWPMFALVSAATWVGMGSLGMPRASDPVAGLLLLGSASRGDMLISVAWSLDLELQFYLSLPLLWLAAQRVPGWQCVLLGFLAWGLGIWLMALGTWNFLLYLPAFAGGMWLTRSRWQPSAGLALAGVAGFLLAGVVLAQWPVTLLLLIKGPGLGLVTEHLGHLAWSALLFPGVAWVLAGPSSARDRQLGDVSYSLYLVHSPLITLLAAVLALDGLALKLVALPAILLATLLLYLWVDMPLESARRHSPAVSWPAFAPLNSGRKRPN